MTIAASAPADAARKKRTMTTQIITRLFFAVVLAFIVFYLVYDEGGK